MLLSSFISTRVDLTLNNSTACIHEAVVKVKVVSIRKKIMEYALSYMSDRNTAYTKYITHHMVSNRKF